jgi:tripartite-type tricarboxylate transporter receptor subunit TctC
MRIVLGILCGALALLGAQAQAQTYPTKPVHIIVPYAPGGIVDLSARVVGQKLSERWGQQVVVENRPGGNGFIGTAAAAKSAADGYTFLVAHTGEFAVAPAVFPKIPFDFERDFTTVTMITEAPMVFVVNDKSPYKSMQELLAAAKARPGTVGVSTPGAGTINHLVLEWVGLNTGANSCMCRTKVARPRSPPPPEAKSRLALRRWGPPCRTSNPAGCASWRSPRRPAALSTSPGRR